MFRFVVDAQPTCTYKPEAAPVDLAQQRVKAAVSCLTGSFPPPRRGVFGQAGLGARQVAPGGNCDQQVSNLLLQTRRGSVAQGNCQRSSARKL